MNTPLNAKQYLIVLLNANGVLTSAQGVNVIKTFDYIGSLFLLRKIEQRVFDPHAKCYAGD